VPYGGGSSVVGGVECDVGDDYRGAAILLVAGTAGSTRLIDNMPMLIGGPR